MDSLLVHEPVPYFADRADAGRQLGDKLLAYAGEGSIVLAVPRGGVPVGFEIATKLRTKLDVVVVRKIRIPWEPEAGYGAVADDGTILLNEPLVRSLNITQDAIEEGISEVKAELERRTAAYRGVRPFPLLQGKTAIVVDDGLASGFTMTVAIRSVRRRDAAHVLVAVPAASQKAMDVVRPECDGITAILVSDSTWYAVASFYREWHDLTDEEVLPLLKLGQGVNNRDVLG